MWTYILTAHLILPFRANVPFWFKRQLCPTKKRLFPTLVS